MSTIWIIYLPKMFYKIFNTYFRDLIAKVHILILFDDAVILANSYQVRVERLLRGGR